MPRELLTNVLKAKAREYAAHWNLPDRRSLSGKRWASGKSWVMQDLFSLSFKDEHEFILAELRQLLGPANLNEFEVLAAEKLTPRSDDVFRSLLAEKLAIDPEGNHVPGAVGTTEVGRRKVGTVIRKDGTKQIATWPVYAGEEDERSRGVKAMDQLPPTGKMFSDNEHLGSVPDGGWQE